MNGRETFALKSALMKTNCVSEVWNLFQENLQSADDYFVRLWEHQIDVRTDRYGRVYCRTCNMLDPAEGWKQADICGRSFSHGLAWQEWIGSKE